MDLYVNETFGYINNNITILNENEYASIVGGFIIIKHFKPNEGKKHMIIKSESTNFSCLDYNPFSKIFAACEVGINCYIRLYAFDSFSNEYKQIGSQVLKDVLEVTDIRFNREGTRLSVLLSDPERMVKIYDIVENSLNELINVTLTHEYKSMKFNPNNSNMIMLFSCSKLTLLKVVDCFREDYVPNFDESDFNDIKAREESILKKRDVLIHHEELNMGSFTDYVWDMYGNIYVSLSKNYIFLYDLRDNSFNRITVSYKDINRDCATLSSPAIAMTLTQRYLVCATENGMLSFVKIYINESVISQFRQDIGTSESYEQLSCERSISLDLEDEKVKFIKFDNSYNKLIVGTDTNSIKIYSLMGEIIVKDKEKEDTKEIDHNQYDNLNYWEVSKSHTERIIAVRELGKTTQLVSVGIDRKIIFWELSDRSGKYIHYIDFEPTAFDVDHTGSFLFIGSSKGVIRIFEISNRSNILERVYNQTKFSELSIDRIIANKEFILFYSINDNMIYFMSNSIINNFQFLGYIKTQFPILQVAIHLDEQGNENEVIVLVDKLLLSYKITSFIKDLNKVTDVKPKKDLDIFTNLEIQYELRARKIDSDLNKMFVSKNSTNVWLIGTDKYFRLYDLPKDLYDVIKDDKKKVEDPLQEIKGHNLKVTCGVYVNNNLITGSLDGTVQIRKDKNVSKQIRTHSYINDGICTIYYSETRKLIYITGNEPGFIILSDNQNYSFPFDIVNPVTNLDMMINADVVELLTDEEITSYKELLINEHYEKINHLKKTTQTALKIKVTEIKNELKNYIIENNSFPLLEQLSKEEMIINRQRIKLEEEEDEILCNEYIRKYFLELCELELLKVRLYEKTFNVMLIKDEKGNVTNNNMRLVCNTSGDMTVKSYSIITLNESNLKKLTYVKKLRLMEINDKYKRRGFEKEVIDESKFSHKGEEYIVNRYPGKITLIEHEIKPSEVMDTIDGDVDRVSDNKRSYKVAKYKLQRDPYENENMKNIKQDDNNEQVGFNPDDQLLKENLNLGFKSFTSKLEEDIEFKENLNSIDSSWLLYSPFELYTSFRIRNQIMLLSDIIHSFKENFNKEFKLFLNERNNLLIKFNDTKSNIENIKEILNVPCENYTYAVNEHEDNDWINKVDEHDIPIPKYLSKDEKRRIQEEKEEQERRLKELSADSFQMRGLNYMIDNTVKTKAALMDEAELVKEPFIDNKRKEDWTAEETQKYMEYLRKEKEIQEKKEKYRSQQLTKLNNYKAEIEALKRTLNEKFLYIAKKKTSTDYLIWQQELYILSLLRTLNSKEDLKKNHLFKSKEYKLAKDKKEKFENIKKKFDSNYEIFKAKYDEVVSAYTEKNKNKFLENKFLFDINMYQESEEDKQYLQQIRSDPFYFTEKDKLKNSKKFGTNPYKEVKSTVNEVSILNQKFYYDYKNDQFNEHKNYIDSQYKIIVEENINLENDFKMIDKELKKAKMNIDILVKIKKSQDEISDDIGPQASIDDSILIESSFIQQLNKEINSLYRKKLVNESKNKNHQDIQSYEELDYQKINLKIYEYKLKSRYLKLTRVTKKIQEIVTEKTDKLNSGTLIKPEVENEKLTNIYDGKKRSLAASKMKREEAMIEKLKALKKEIDKKRKDNRDFIVKIQKLREKVDMKSQIMDLDEYKPFDEAQKNTKPMNKALEIAEITEYKNLVQQYYEEIEFLRTELDKLRARTFPSFLPKPENIIYPDER